MFGMEWTGQAPEDQPSIPAAQEHQAAGPLNVYGAALAIAGLLIAIWAFYAHLPHLMLHT